LQTPLFVLSLGKELAHFFTSFQPAKRKQLRLRFG
jgi:hypothetical protein